MNDEDAKELWELSEKLTESKGTIEKAFNAVNGFM